MDGGEVVASLSERTLGRTTAEDVLDPLSGAVLVPNNTLIEETQAELIEKAGVEQVKIRSVLTCEAAVGVCAHCYGRDLARGTPVNIGEAVGVIAAQSNRRAGHAADHAHVPHRRCGTARGRGLQRGGEP